MKNYMFETTTTMKEYNNNKYWIDADYIRRFIVAADNLKAALEKYREHVGKMYVDISENSLKNKRPMYVDLKTGGSKQIGYVITGKSDFQRSDDTWTAQYIDLWVRISEVNDIEFPEN